MEENERSRMRQKKKGKRIRRRKFADNESKRSRKIEGRNE